MKSRFWVWFLIILTLLTIGCKKQEVSVGNSGEHQSITKKVEIGQETTDNIITDTGDDSGETYVSDVKQSNKVFNKNEPFYYDYYEEFGEGSKGNYVLKLMDRDGIAIWEHKWIDLEGTELGLGWEPMKSGNQIFVGVYGDLYALDYETGEVNWSAPGTGSTVRPVVSNGVVYMAGYYGPMLSAVDEISGKVLWIKENPENYGWATKIIDGDNEIIVLCTEFNGENIEDALIKYDTDGNVSGYDMYTGDQFLPQFWDNVYASSTLEPDTAKYIPENIWDQNFETAWVEGASGYGLAEWIEMAASNPNDIEYISIANGYQKSEETYFENGRLSKYRIDFSTGDYFISEAFYASEIFSEEHIQLVEPIRANSVRLTILEAVPGTKYEDLAITEWMTR